jgi:hypothetical protein
LGRYEPVPTIATLFIKYPLSVEHIFNYLLIEQKRARYVKGNMPLGGRERSSFGYSGNNKSGRSRFKRGTGCEPQKTVDITAIYF